MTVCCFHVLFAPVIALLSVYISLLGVSEPAFSFYFPLLFVFPFASFSRSCFHLCAQSDIFPSRVCSNFFRVFFWFLLYAPGFSLSVVHVFGACFWIFCAHRASFPHSTHSTSDCLPLKFSLSLSTFGPHFLGLRFYFCSTQVSITDLLLSASEYPLRSLT